MTDRPQKVWKNYDRKYEDVVKAFRIVEENHDLLMKAWEGIHGKASE